MCRTASHKKASPGTQQFKKHALVVTALVYRIRHSDEEEDDDDDSDNDDDNDDDNDTTALSMLELFEQYTSVRFRLGSWVESDGLRKLGTLVVIFLTRALCQPAQRLIEKLLDSHFNPRLQRLLPFRYTCHMHKHLLKGTRPVDSTTADRPTDRPTDQANVPAEKNPHPSQVSHFS